MCGSTSRLTSQQENYRTAANSWIEVASRFAAQTKTQQNNLLLLAIVQVLVTALVVAFVVEPVIRRLQRERSEGDRIAKEQSRLVAIIERAGSAVVISDPKGRIEWINQGFVRLTGYTSKRESPAARRMRFYAATEPIRQHVRRFAAPASTREAAAGVGRLLNYTRGGEPRTGRISTFSRYGRRAASSPPSWRFVPTSRSGAGAGNLAGRERRRGTRIAQADSSRR